MLHRRLPVDFDVRKIRRDSSAIFAPIRQASIVTGETTLLKLPSGIEAVNEVASTVAGILKGLGITDDASFGIDLAVREAVTNAVLHGNKQDQSKLVEVNVKASPDALEILVHDEGSGFVPENVPDPTQSDNILKSSGRGIFFMHNFMDEVEWFIKPGGGTTVRLFKKL
jgi:serine/threonine-protein kinase RsbW